MVPDKEYKSDIDWIDTHACLRAVCAPLDTIIEELDDNLVFEEIESEMMKRGTLAHHAIRWDFVFDEATHLLQEKAKDFRLLTFILYALPQLSSTASVPVPLALGAHLVASFVNQWGRVATPQGRAAPRALARLVDALDGLVKRAEEAGLDESYRPIIIRSFEQTAQSLSENVPDIATKFASLNHRVEKIEGEETQDVPPENLEKTAPTPENSTVKEAPPHGASTGMSASASHPTNAPRSSDLALDRTNERALRESLAKVADFLFDLNHDQPLSYRLRRYACWYGLREQPALKKDAATIIMPPSEESVDLYTQAVAQKQTDADIAKRLERSCYLQPFWIEGHYLAWNLARGRGAMQVAGAIFEEVSQFVKTLPWIERLQFASGQAFMPEEVRNWLASHQTISTGVPTTQILQAASQWPSQGEGNKMIDEARALADKGDMMAAIQHMEEARTLPSDIRERSLWEIDNLELLSEWGLKTHAASSATRLEEAIRILNVADWEGGIFERLRRLKSATP